MTSTRRRAVLIGAGHAHLYVAKRAEAFLLRGVELVLVDPDAFWYSGLATGMLGGMYGPDNDRVAVGPLIERHKGRFVRERAAHLDTTARVVHLASGTKLPYDAVSLSIGSEVPLEEIPNDGAQIWPVKPISTLWRLRQYLEREFRSRKTSDPLHVTVLGGGATGCEVAANIDALARSHRASVRVTVISRSGRLVPSHPPAVSRTLIRVLRKRGVELALTCAAERIENGVVVAGGERFEADAIVVATGLRPPLWIRDLGLPVDQHGGLRVDSTLQSLVDERVFGAGDCISIEGNALPKLGVFGVRQGPILFHNLLSYLRGHKLKVFRPQRRWLSILNLGDGTGLATWSGFSWHGRSSLWLKDRIDRRFLAQYRVEPGQLDP